MTTPTQTIVVGEGACSIEKVFSALKLSPSFHLIQDKLSDIAIDLDLETPAAWIKKTKNDMILDKATLTDAVIGLIEQWVGRKGSGATLQELVKVLEDNELENCAESLKKVFTHQASASVTRKKFSRAPSGILDFLARVDPTKLICIVLSMDPIITCEKLRENRKDFAIHSFNDFLQMLSETYSSDGITYFMVVSSLKQLKGMLSLVIGETKFTFKLVVVTQLENKKGFMELLKSHPAWKEIVHVFKDQMDWNDLTPLYKNEIETKLEKVFKVDFDDDDGLDGSFSLNGQVLADVINGQAIRLFKTTLPRELPYYVGRKLVTRHFISPQILEQPAPDVFLFTGMTRPELSEFVRNKLTDVSTNQIRRTKLTVMHMLLDDTSHFDRICQKTTGPVHLLHFDNGRLRWCRSRRGMGLLQGAIDTLQEHWSESQFLWNLRTDSNLSIVISDSPGIGKSTLLAQIGNELTRVFPQRKVFFVALNEFMRRLKKVEAEHKTTSIKKALQALICKNVVGEAVLNSMLKSNDDSVLIELLLDGFDELARDDIKLTHETLQTILAEFRSTRIWVTSRRHFLCDLENSVNALGYTIQPFDEEDQIKFLVSYWSRENQMNQKKLLEFAEKCLRMIKTNMKAKDNDISGIPLQCLLIGDVYEDEAMDYATSEQSLFPPVSVTSITELYKSLIDKKIQKYLTIYSKTEEEKLKIVDSHARLSLELVFPEHVGKLKHLFGTRLAQVDEILNVGILEQLGSTEVPRFIHRTLAEYFVAGFAINRILTVEPGAANIDISGFLADMLSSYDSFSNNSGIDSFAFTHPVICYFFDSLITDLDSQNVVTSNQVDITKALNVVETMKKIVHSCVNADLYQLVKFLHEINQFDKHGETIFTKELLLLGIEKSGVELVKLILTILEHHRSFDLAMQAKSLRAAMRWGDFPIVEYLIKERGLRVLVEEFNEHTTLLLHECVKDSRDHPPWKLSQMSDIIKLIVGINPRRLEEVDQEGRTALLAKHVHTLLKKELIVQGANVLVSNFKNETVLHFQSGWNNMPCEEYQELLTCIPSPALKKLVLVKRWYGQTPLGSLVQALDPMPATLTILMSHGADFNCLDNGGSPILEIAIKNGRRGETIQKLIECGAKATEWRGRKNETLLHIATQFGNLGAANILVDTHGMEVNATDINGLTPLDYAIRSDYKFGKILETGLTLHGKEGRFKDLINSDGESWLFMSGQGANPQSIELLLQIGMDTNVVDSQGNTPLHLLMLRNVDPLIFPIVSLFLDHKADPNALNNSGKTPLQLSLEAGNMNIETFKLFYGYAARWSPLLASLALKFIIEDGYALNESELSTIVQELEAHEADISQRDGFGNTLIHMAVDCHNEKAVKLLLKTRPNINSTNNLEQTPLHLAAYPNFNRDKTLDIITCLIENDADVSLKDWESHTFLHTFAEECPTANEFHSVAVYLADKKLSGLFNVPGATTGVTPFQLAVKNLELEDNTLSMLSLSDVNFNAVDKGGWSVLAHAVQGKRSAHFLSRLIVFGADWKFQTNNKSNMLQLAAQYGSLESLNFFLDLGGLEVDSVNENGDTPLNCVMIRKEEGAALEMATALLEHGAVVPRNYSKLSHISKKLKCMMMKYVQFPKVQQDLNSELDNTAEEVISKLANCTGLSEENEESSKILHNFITSSRLSPSQLHRICDYLSSKKLIGLLNNQYGLNGSTPFQEALYRLEAEVATLNLLHANFFNFNKLDKDGNSILAYVIRGRGKPEFLSILISEYGVDPKLLNANKENLLHCSAQHGNPESLNVLLELNIIDVNERDKLGRTPLYHLVRYSNHPHLEGLLSMYRLLVSHGADVNSSDNIKSTLLHAATFREKKVSLELIKSIVEDNANTDAKDGHKDTFLCQYICNEPRPIPSEFHSMVEYLHEKGIINLFNEGDGTRTTPLLHAVKYFEPEEATLLRLHTSGINFNHLDGFACGMLKYAILARRSNSFLATLINRFGADLRKLYCESGILHWLVEYGSLEQLTFLMDLSLERTEGNRKNSDGCTPLHITMRHTKTDTFKIGRFLILHHDADVNALDHWLRTPLHYAGAHPNKEVALKCIKYLIEQGSDPFAKDKEYLTFLHNYVTDSLTPLGLHALVEYLISKNLTSLFDVNGGVHWRTPLHFAVYRLEPEEETLMLLHSRGVSFNAVDDNGNSLLAFSVIGKRSKEFVSSLIKRFEADTKQLNDRGESHLHTAAHFGTEDALKLFLDLGDLGINGVDSFGNTPLHHAVSRKTDALARCKMLVSHGADVTALNEKGKSPLSIAKKSGYEKGYKKKLLKLLQPLPPQPQKKPGCQLQ